mmetsp:Transcript_17572/g.31543  ORF Transcript_17572/g.31543 Transcript_17572/m.31543 type:complete len:80 (-) Transcript_17572:214-453(-)
MLALNMQMEEFKIPKLKIFQTNPEWTHIFEVQENEFVNWGKLQQRGSNRLRRGCKAFEKEQKNAVRLLHCIVMKTFKEK